MHGRRFVYYTGGLVCLLPSRLSRFKPPGYGVFRWIAGHGRRGVSGSIASICYPWSKSTILPGKSVANTGLHAVE